MLWPEGQPLMFDTHSIGVSSSGSSNICNARTCVDSCTVATSVRSVNYRHRIGLSNGRVKAPGYTRLDRINHVRNIWMEPQAALWSTGAQGTGCFDLQRANECCDRSAESDMAMRASTSGSIREFEETGIHFSNTGRSGCFWLLAAISDNALA